MVYYGTAFRTGCDHRGKPSGEAGTEQRVPVDGVVDMGKRGLSRQALATGESGFGAKGEPIFDADGLTGSTAEQDAGDQLSSGLRGPMEGEGSLEGGVTVISREHDHCA